MTIRIKSDRVLEAAKKCPAAKEVLEILFPTVFGVARQPKFQLGDIVSWHGNASIDVQPGMIGKVVVTDFPGDVGVEFQKAIIGGHACRGKGLAGHCWYLREQFLTLVYRQPRGDQDAA